MADLYPEGNRADLLGPPIKRGIHDIDDGPGVHEHTRLSGRGIGFPNDPWAKSLAPVS